ncbi:uncharacterized protein LOC132203496 [Neocloeon triangulifer]|uniref:uncharacterized protein LOC132203496 n=1 Tax=Neocloeon triangulifer TaxID=2078957 RepID=UPI00286F0779|nr:uncharacterized protein LOC132203496 [Neocloeon triangulifer]
MQYSKVKRNTEFTGFYRSGCVVLKGCKREFVACFGTPKNKFSYYQSAKWACGDFYKYKLVSFESREKLDCVLELFKIYNITNNRFYVSATSLGCVNSIRWCNYLDNSLVQDSYIKWAKGEPSTDPSKECVYVDYDSAKIEFTFAKTNCKADIFSMTESLTSFESNTLGIK